MLPVEVKPPYSNTTIPKTIPWNHQFRELEWDFENTQKLILALKLF